ncbi:haloacid dehalogenase [Irpex rosettiformis]|uniref:Haloacid dehalogenase n=1 Tax=Irpex rosettiformis TaxID=378272 RepID=A0ACB8U462_9APHY|nr:haloacid dehalogenase [Irpex rosettiformis]
MVTQNDPTLLKGVEAFLFDVFGTVVDWQGSVSKQLSQHYEGLFEIDWIEFTNEWRAGYMAATAPQACVARAVLTNNRFYHGNRKRIAADGSGSTNVDIIHRELLDEMLASRKWEHLGKMWGDEKRREINLVWHKLEGWPDSSGGLYSLKKQAIIGTLSNGNVRLLADMAKFANLPWDVIFSGELIGSYKPNPKVYLGALHHLSVPPRNCVMVAAHIYDLQHAALHGMKTVYVRRATEDLDKRDSIKSKANGGEVDLVVDSILELAELFQSSAGL